MDDFEIKTDSFGWKYYTRLPDGFRLALMDDFHVKGKKKVGMEYLIQRGDQQYFEIHFVTEDIRAESLVPFFEWDMIFVKT
jgi:hypothetical protein